MIKKLNWEAYSGQKRIQVIEEIKQAISMNDGCITNFNIFSDLALSLSIEIEENKIGKLYNALYGIVGISDFDACILNPASVKEWLIFMNISFSHGTSTLKNQIPEVPG